MLWKDLLFYRIVYTAARAEWLVLDAERAERRGAGHGQEEQSRTSDQSAVVD
jgi:hypothetical protein